MAYRFGIDSRLYRNRGQNSGQLQGGNYRQISTKSPNAADKIGILLTVGTALLQCGYGLYISRSMNLQGRRVNLLGISDIGLELRTYYTATLPAKPAAPAEVAQYPSPITATTRHV